MTNRDYKKMPIFLTADRLAFEAYQATEALLAEDGSSADLRSEIRSHARHVVCGIIDGCLPHRQKSEFAHCIDMAVGEAVLARYLLGLSARLNAPHAIELTKVAESYDTLIRELQDQIA